MRFFLNLLFCLFIFSNLQAWQVVMTKEACNFNNPQWELQIPARDEAVEKDDIEMWQNINAFIDVVRPFCDFTDGEYQRMLPSYCEKKPMPTYTRGPDWILENLLKCELYFSKPRKDFFGKSAEYTDHDMGLGTFINQKGFESTCTLPEGFWEALSKLTFLRVVSIHNFKIEGLPASIAKLENLYGLSIYSGFFDEPLPDEIGHLLYLERLTLSFCGLTTLPPSIGSLQSLNHLTLDNNVLEALPDEIGDLKNLYWLNLKDNKLHALPATFINLQMLSNLNLEYNAFEVLPDVLINLESLWGLELAGNGNLQVPSDAFFERFKNQGLRLPDHLHRQYCHRLRTPGPPTLPDDDDWDSD